MLPSESPPDPPVLLRHRQLSAGVCAAPWAVACGGRKENRRFCRADRDGRFGHHDEQNSDLHPHALYVRYTHEMWIRVALIRDGRIVRYMDLWMDGWMDGWMDRHSDIYRYSVTVHR